MSISKIKYYQSSTEKKYESSNNLRIPLNGKYNLEVSQRRELVIVINKHGGRERAPMTSKYQENESPLSHSKLWLERFSSIHQQLEEKGQKPPWEPHRWKLIWLKAEVLSPINYLFRIMWIYYNFPTLDYLISNRAKNCPLQSSTFLTDHIY